MNGTPWGCFYNGGIPGGNNGACTNLGFFVMRAANQTIPDTTETVIDIDTIVEENPGGTFDLVNNRFECTIPGRYVFCLSIDLTVSFFGYAECRLYVNGTLRTDERAEADEEELIKIGNSFCFQLDIGDLVQARVFMDDGFAGTLNGGQNQFSGALICTP
jgi:hypothetical protein